MYVCVCVWCDCVRTQLGAPLISGRLSYPSAMTPFPEHRHPAIWGKRQWRLRVRVLKVRLLKKMISTALFVILNQMAVKQLFTFHLPRPEPQNMSFVFLIKPNLSLMRSFRYISTRHYLHSTPNHSPIYKSYAFQ
jgi:hypothetical protein